MSDFSNSEGLLVSSGRSNEQKNGDWHGERELCRGHRR